MVCRQQFLNWKESCILLHTVGYYTKTVVNIVGYWCTLTVVHPTRLEEEGAQNQKLLSEKATMENKIKGLEEQMTLSEDSVSKVTHTHNTHTRTHIRPRPHSYHETRKHWKRSSKRLKLTSRQRRTRQSRSIVSDSSSSLTSRMLKRNSTERPM